LIFAPAQASSESDELSPGCSNFNCLLTGAAEMTTLNISIRRHNFGYPDLSL